MTIAFAHNPTGWDGDGPVRGGMSDTHIAPVLAHLRTPHVETDRPGEVEISVYYTFGHTYPAHNPAGVQIFFGHGIADKSWRDASKVKGFDWVATSGPAWTQRLVAGGYPPERILEVGYPKLDPIFGGQVTSPWPERDGRVRVLWAPTHGGGGEKYRHSPTPPATAGARRTTHWRRDQILDLLDPDRFLVVEALHPRHRPDGQATLAEFVGADVVIADGGSTIYEAWALDLPVVFPSWATGQAHLDKRGTTFEGAIYRDSVGRHAGRPEDLPRLVVDAARQGITEAEQRFVAPILPVAYRGHGGRRFAEALDDIANGRPVPRHSGTTPKAVYLSRSGEVDEVWQGSIHAQRREASPRWKLVT